MKITVYVYIKKVSHLPLQLGIFAFTLTVKHFHIYGALLHLALKVFTLMPQSHTHLRTLTESFGSNRSRPQKNEGVF